MKTWLESRDKVKKTISDNLYDYYHNQHFCILSENPPRIPPESYENPTKITKNSYKYFIPPIEDQHGIVVLTVKAILTSARQRCH